MSADNRIVTVVIVEDVMIEVISCERGGTELYFWRTSNEDKILFTSGSLWGTVEEALDAAMQHVLPDLGIRQIPEPDEQDFEMLNMMLGFSAPEGAISSLFEALQWHNKLFDSLERLEAARAAALTVWEAVLAMIVHTSGADSTFAAEAMLTRDIQTKQFEMSKHFADRDLDVLASFLEHYLGKRG